MCADTKTLRVDRPSDWEARGQPLSQSEHLGESAAALSGQRAEVGGGGMG